MFLDESLLISKQNIKKFSKKKLKGYIEPNESEEIKMENGLFLNESMILTEKAKFSILPKFKMFCNKYPEMKEHSGLMSEIETILAESGKDGGGKVVAIKIAKIILRIYGMLLSIESVILLPLCILCFPILGLFINRFFKFLVETGEFRLAETQSNIMISKLVKLKNETKDPAVKKKCDDQIELIKKNKERLVNESFEFELEEACKKEELDGEEILDEEELDGEEILDEEELDGEEILDEEDDDEEVLDEGFFYI